MNVQLGKLIDSVDSLKAILASKMEVSKAFALAKSIQSVDKELTAYESVRTEKVKELGEEKDGNYTVKTENMDAFMEALNTIRNTEVDIAFPEIKSSDIKGDIEASVFLSLDYLIKE